MKLSLPFVLILLAFQAYSQTETAAWNGKTYYVYPYQVELDDVDLFDRYADSTEVLQRDDKNRKVTGVTVVPLDRKKRKVRLIERMSYNKQRRKIYDLLVHYPHFYYKADYSSNTEPIPTLEPLPDGEYIQYYRDVPYMDGKTMRFHNTVVAGTFTIVNNQLDGQATWITPDGKLLRTGSYSNGSRTGTWTSYEYKSAKSNREINIKKWSTDKIAAAYRLDTLIETIDFSNGLKNGNYLKLFNGNVLESGAYTNEQPSGSWEIYVQKNLYTPDYYKDPYALALQKRFTYATGNKIGHGVIIREELIYDLYQEEGDTTYSFPESYGMDLMMELPEFGDFYTIGGTEAPIELPEEDNGISGYEGDDYRYSHEENLTRNQLIDSLGYHFNYQGVYEEFYPNGQLKMRFETDSSGNLIEEGPVFWDNGQPASVVVFNPEKQFYRELFYDYKGKVYLERIYDLYGEPVEEEAYALYEIPGIIVEKTVTIDGLDYRVSDGDFPLYSYKNPEALIKLPQGRTLIEKRLWADRSEASSAVFDMNSRTYDYTEFTLDHQPLFTQQLVFSENFEYLNVTERYKLGDLSTETIYNGKKKSSDFYSDLADSASAIPFSGNLKTWYRDYKTEHEELFYKKGKLFTGRFSINGYRKRFSIKGNEHTISLSIPEDPYSSQVKAAENYNLKGKRSLLLQTIRPDDYTSSHPTNPISIFPESPDQKLLYPEFSMNSRMLSEEGTSPAYNSRIEGSFLKGRPEGQWITYDQNGEPTRIISFTGGQLNGETIRYETEPGINAENRGYYDENPYEGPEKNVRYLHSKGFFKNGFLQGPYVYFNWKGDTTLLENYELGYLSGPGFERYRRGLIVSYYDHNKLHGITRVWLNVPGKEPALRMELNFRNGLLQGESNTYHSNGKVASRGFFLNNEAIDDYEAFDSLGNRYQYVRFQYGQPVEERIWEENELSVLYRFRWEDSVEFDMRSLVAGELDGLRERYYDYPGNEEEAYFGRPSVLEKRGINYTMTKYYPNDQVARIGKVIDGKKTGLWNYYSYEGREMYRVQYFDSIIKISDSVKFRTKGILTYLDEKGAETSRSYIIEKFEKYDCAHTDHYEERMLATIWEKDTSVHRINGYAKNYYDNGVLQNEGRMVNGLPEGIWKLYDASGNLSHVGEYVQGKRQGRWLSGDLANINFLGDICLNPNMENLEETMKYQENILDIEVNYYRMGTVLKSEFYGIDMNAGGMSGQDNDDY